MKIYKITEASDYLGVSINTLKTLANNGKIKSFKTTGEHRRFRQEDLDAYMGVDKFEMKGASNFTLRERIAELELHNALLRQRIATLEAPPPTFTSSSTSPTVWVCCWCGGLLEGYGLATCPECGLTKCVAACIPNTVCVKCAATSTPPARSENS